jgi:hypothetical protein
VLPPRCPASVPPPAPVDLAPRAPVPTGPIGLPVAADGVPVRAFRTEEHRRLRRQLLLTASAMTAASEWRYRAVEPVVCVQCGAHRAVDMVGRAVGLVSKRRRMRRRGSSGPAVRSCRRGEVGAGGHAPRPCPAANAPCDRSRLDRPPVVVGDRRVRSTRRSSAHEHPSPLRPVGGATGSPSLTVCIEPPQ